MVTCNDSCMSEMPAPQASSVPVFDRADRMRKALRHADIGVQEMADYLGVSRNTVSNWIGGRINPGTQTLRLWALRTGVPYTWLCHNGLDSCSHARLSGKADCLIAVAA